MLSHRHVPGTILLFFMVIRLVAQSDPLSLELLAPLPVDLQATLIGLRQSVVAEDSTHVMQHTTDTQHHIGRSLF